MRAGLAGWLRFAALGALIAAWGCGPEFMAGAGGAGGSGGPNTGGGGPSTGGSGPSTGGGGPGGSGGGSCAGQDADGDGHDRCTDCDDNNPQVNPGSAEICGDALDNDCDSTLDPEDFCKGLGTFVTDSGDDANPGTTALPVRTIARAVEIAGEIGAGTHVYVAEGNYPEDVVLTEGVSLLGGYAPDFVARDPRVHDTNIQCQTYACVRAGNTITRATEMDGFIIQGRAGQPATPPGSVAVQLNGGAPTLRHNKILAGQVNGTVNNAKNSVAVQILGPAEEGGPLLESNEITGGPATEISIAVVIETQGVAEIRQNRIRSGAGTQSYAVYDKGSAATTRLVGNDIQTGSASSTNAFAVRTHGQIEIEGNRINADTTAPPTCVNTVLWCGGIGSYSSKAAITNNIVFGVSSDNSTAMYLGEVDMAAQQVQVHSNYLHAGGKATPGAAAKSAAIVLHSPYAGQPNAQLGYIRNNILVGGSNTTRYGVYEESTSNQTSSPSAFTHNIFFFPAPAAPTDTLYRDWAMNVGTNWTMLSQIPPGYSNNLTGDPRIDASFHLMSGSPCIDAGSSESAPATDFEGDSRPQGSAHDIGPDEAR